MNTIIEMFPAIFLPECSGSKNIGTVLRGTQWGHFPPITTLLPTTTVFS